MRWTTTIRLALGLAIFVSGMMANAVFPVAGQAISDTLAAMQTACDEVYPDSNNVNTPDPRMICKKIVQVIYTDVGSACRDFSDSDLVAQFKIDSNKVDRIVRHGEKDGTAYQVILREPQVVFVPFGTIELEGKLYGQGMWLWAKSFTWRCKTLKRMLEEKSGQTSQPATPSACPRSLSELRQFGEVLRELEHPAGTLAGAVMRLSGNSQDRLRTCGWTLQGEAADVKSVWSPNHLRPLPR